MNTIHVKEGDHVRIADGTATVPQGWWGRDAVVVEVESEPANESIGIQAQIKFSNGGLEPIVPVTCLEAA
jgi:hypothetical protein